MGNRSSKATGYTPLLAVQSPVPDDIDIAQSVPPQHVSTY